MSFQDVGKKPRPRRPQGSDGFSQGGGGSGGGGGGGARIGPGGGDPFAAVSDGIIQYQRNVGILERIVRQVGTKSDGAELKAQYNAQVDVCTQLATKVEQQLKMCEHRLATMDRTEASKRRATHIKLSKDFRTVETACKNIILDTRRKLAHTATHQLPKSVFGNAPGNHETTTQEEERVQMQMQLQQERLNEEIMRERESEIRNINRGMHQVNEIYKDLAHIVSSQQEQVDQIETQMESSKVNAEQGLTHIQKANARAENSQCTIS